jgi:Lon protease-like protein
MEAKVYELPLFPLNVVLFPGQTLPLHIFEMRYRVMIQRCVDNNEPFGVVLAQDEEPDRPFDVGTSARVTEVKRLPDGRLNIMAMGQERFKLHDFRVSEDEYLIGDVSAYPFDEREAPQLELTAMVSRRLSRYLKLLADANGMRFRFDQFPTAPMEVAVFGAIALRLPLEVKQELLTQQCVVDLLRMESDVLGEELKMLKIVASAIRPPEDGHIFSRN